MIVVFKTTYRGPQTHIIMKKVTHRSSAHAPSSIASRFESYISLHRYYNTLPRTCQAIIRGQNMTWHASRTEKG